jgi:hypothetical protein
MTLSAENVGRPQMEKLTNDNKDGALLLLSQVEKLANEGHNQKEIAKALGFKTTFTLNNRLVKASQITGKPVPKYKPNRQGKKELKRVETVEVKRRGKGSAFGVNVPQEPLMRAGLKPGDKLRVSVRGKTISLTR